MSLRSQEPCCNRAHHPAELVHAPKSTQNGQKLKKKKNRKENDEINIKRITKSNIKIVFPTGAYVGFRFCSKFDF